MQIRLQAGGRQNTARHFNDRTISARIERNREKMEKKLFRVRVILYVMAENESEACVAATNARFDIFECAAKKAEHLEPGWDSAIPYNSEDYRSCAEILADQRRVFYDPTPSQTRAGRVQSMLQTRSNSATMQASPG